MSVRPDQLVIPLRRPVALAGENYTALNLREPTSGELLVINKHSGTTADILAVSCVAGVPQAAVRLIGAGDLLKAADFIVAVLKVVDDDLPAAGADWFELDLRLAVRHGEETWSVLRLREPTAGELEAFNKLENTERDIVAVATVSGAPRAVIEKTLARDMLTAMAFINSFLQGAPPTPGK